MKKNSFVLVLVVLIALTLVGCKDDNLVCPTGPQSCYNPNISQPSLADKVENLANHAQNTVDNTADALSKVRVALDNFAHCTDVIACDAAFQELKATCQLAGGTLNEQNVCEVR